MKRIKIGQTADKWGFDSTEISAENWKELLSLIGASEWGEKEESNGYFIWEGNDVVVISGNNPITGEYMYPERREPEVGYAGYIGIEGNPETVSMIADFIRESASFIKDESPGSRDFI